MAIWVPEKHWLSVTGVNWRNIDNNCLSETCPSFPPFIFFWVGNSFTISVPDLDSSLKQIPRRGSEFWWTCKSRGSWPCHRTFYGSFHPSPRSRRFTSLPSTARPNRTWSMPIFDGGEQPRRGEHVILIWKSNYLSLSVTVRPRMCKCKINFRDTTETASGMWGCDEIAMMDDLSSKTRHDDDENRRNSMFESQWWWRDG